MQRNYWFANVYSNERDEVIHKTNQIELWALVHMFGVAPKLALEQRADAINYKVIV